MSDLTRQCPRCGWLHIEVHAGYACPCVPCECTKGTTAPHAGPAECPLWYDCCHCVSVGCLRCEGNGWRMKGGQSGGLVVIKPGESQFSPGVVPSGRGNPRPELKQRQVYAEQLASAFEGYAEDWWNWMMSHRGEPVR